ncbi:MAG: hypothetical protein JXQ76_10525, partial [Campylobacterales bacterium]|nr:hypothetical protein [Campylobacterales bacterium]
MKKLLHYLLLVALFTSQMMAEPQESIHILVESKNDYEIAQDIKNIANDTIHFDVYYDNYKNIIDKVLTDPKAQFAIIPHDVLLYERDIVKREAIENNIKIIMPLYDKYIYILTRKDSGINSVYNLMDKRINIELAKNEFSVTGRLIQKTHNIHWIETHESYETALKKLMNKEIDAVLLIDAQKSKKLSMLSNEQKEALKFISPDMNERDYPTGYITPFDYPWIGKETKTNSINEVLISYNYQPSDTIERFNYYVNNISTLIHLVAKNMEYLRANAHSYWKDIEPFYFQKIDWPLHTIAKKSILKYMDILDSFTNTFGMHFVTVPSGSSVMGSNDTTLPKDERPQVQTALNSFSIMTTEVTQKQ